MEDFHIYPAIACVRLGGVVFFCLHLIYTLSSLGVQRSTLTFTWSHNSRLCFKTVKKSFLGQIHTELSNFTLLICIGRVCKTQTIKTLKRKIKLCLLKKHRQESPAAARAMSTDTVPPGPCVLIHVPGQQEVAR